MQQQFQEKPYGDNAWINGGFFVLEPSVLDLIEGDRSSWDAYNEGEDLIDQAEKYKLDTGSYPERICADRIYITAANRHYCTRNGIRLSVKP